MSNKYDEEIAVLRMELDECDAELVVVREHCKSLYNRRGYIKEKLDRALKNKRKDQMKAASEYFNPMTDMEIIDVILSDGSISGIKL